MIKRESVVALGHLVENVTLDASEHEICNLETGLKLKIILPINSG